MRTSARVLGWLLAGTLAAPAGITLAARLHDGPLGILAGGPLVAGELATGAEPDWSFVRDVPTVELQLRSPARSRTTWVLHARGRAYVPCGYMTSWLGRLWKQWPREAERDGRAVVRIDGRRYARRLVRVTEPALVAELTAELSRKYGVPASPVAVADGSLWLFELAPDQAAGPR
jgi:hypothetical protein